MNFFWHIHGHARIETPLGDVSVAPDRWDPAIHLGRIEDGGRYCASCKRSLCVGGIRSIASARPEDWYEACPECGASVSGKVRLFRWRQDPVRVRQACRSHLEDLLVLDGQGVLLTGKAFLVLTEDCSLHWLDSGEPVRPWR